MQIGKKDFDTENNTYIMGILNVTPDSFSDGGKFTNKEQALRQCEKMINEGADIIDIGGESTRPNYTMISQEEEISRIIPVVELIKREFDPVISLDTYKSKVAEAGIQSGVDLINDIWGLKYDDNMAGIIAKNQVACCLMHNRMDMNYYDFLANLENDILDCVYLARKAGIEESKIILDPGVGFAKTYENNLEVIHNLERLQHLGYPILLGTSRKSVIGITLEVPADERMIGTVVTSVFAVMKGCSFLRVHDVKENLQAIKMSKAILLG